MILVALYDILGQILSIESKLEVNMTSLSYLSILVPKRTALKACVMKEVGERNDKFRFLIDLEALW